MLPGSRIGEPTGAEAGEDDRLEGPGRSGRSAISPRIVSASGVDGRIVEVVVETPKGSHNKLKYDAERAAFRLSHVLPIGMTFPFDFGFLPNTTGGDGDPLDVLVLMDAPCPTGCIVDVRLVGVLEVEQREKSGTVVRNDRLIGVADTSATHAATHELADLAPAILQQIEAFFSQYNRLDGKEFRVLHRRGRVSEARRTTKPFARDARLSLPALLVATESRQLPPQGDQDPRGGLVFLGRDRQHLGLVIGAFGDDDHGGRAGPFDVELDPANTVDRDGQRDSRRVCHDDPAIGDREDGIRGRRSGTDVFSGLERMAEVGVISLGFHACRSFGG